MCEYVHILIGRVFTVMRAAKCNIFFIMSAEIIDEAAEHACESIPIATVLPQSGVASPSGIVQVPSTIVQEAHEGGLVRGTWQWLPATSQAEPLGAQPAGTSICPLGAPSAHEVLGVRPQEPLQPSSYPTALPMADPADAPLLSSGGQGPDVDYEAKQLLLQSDSLGLPLEERSLASQPEVAKPPTGNATLALQKRKYPESCSCESTGCLKGYCVCFTAERACLSGVCKCRGCRNDDGEAARLSRQAKARRRRTIRTSSAGVRCNCTRSGCAKAYCECYRVGAACTSACRCTACRNAVSDDAPPAPTWMGIVIEDVD